MTAFILPAGTTPAGFGVTTERVETQSPPVILADAIDPTTGELLSLTRGMDPTDAAVITALRTVRGTGASVRAVGQRFADVTHVDDAAAQMLEHLTRAALRHLVEDRQIRIERIAVTADQNTDWAEVVVAYENLRTSRRQTAQIRARRHGN